MFTYSNFKIYFWLNSILSFLWIISFLVLISIISININYLILNLFLLISPIIFKTIVYFYFNFWFNKKIKYLKNIQGILISSYFKSSKKLEPGNNTLYTIKLFIKFNLNFSIISRKLTISMITYKQNGEISSKSQNLNNTIIIKYNSNRLTINYLYDNDPEDKKSGKKNMIFHVGNGTLDVIFKEKNKLERVNGRYVNDFINRSSFGDIKFQI